MQYAELESQLAPHRNKPWRDFARIAVPLLVRHFCDDNAPFGYNSKEHRPTYLNDDGNRCAFGCLLTVAEVTDVMEQEANDYFDALYANADEVIDYFDDDNVVGTASSIADASHRGAFWNEVQRSHDRAAADQIDRTRLRSLLLSHMENLDAAN